MVQKRHDIVLLLLGVLVLLLIVINSLVFFTRIDLSSTSSNSISEVSKQLFSRIQEPIRITYYLSGRLLKQDARTQQIADLLGEYALWSSGKIVTQIVDPDGQEEALRLENIGLQPQELRIVENNQRTSALVYTGIKIEYLNSYKIIPFVIDPGTIEYEVTSLLTSMIEKRNRVLGILTGGTGQDIDNQFQILNQQLGRNAEIRLLSAGEVIPADVDVVFVLKEQTLQPIDAFHLDQFIMSGKGVLFGIDTVGVSLSQGIVPIPIDPGPITALLESYGFTIQKGWVLDEYNKPIVVNRQAGQVMIQQLEPYPAWVSVSGEGLNMDNLITARSGGLDLLWASPVSLREGISGEILARSSGDSVLLSAVDGGDPQQLDAAFATSQEPRKSYDMAVLLTGGLESSYKGKDFRSLFPSLDIQTIIDNVQNARVLVVGDSEFASDIIQYSDSGYNIGFLNNVFEWLSNDQDLLSLRTRQVRDTRLNLIPNPSQRNIAANTAWTINTIGVPLILVGIGVYRFLKRRRIASSLGGKK